jgi:ABC-2 type transport system permease protein
VLIALWLGYTGIALFFYFGDAFAADRRNNAMLFWKSMPVTDIKILSAKFLAGVTLFPAIVYAMAVASGLLLIVALNIAPWTFPGFSAPNLGMTLMSFVQITLFGIIYVAFAMLWYAPFMAWVGGLSAVFGRWSLPLAFVIPGLLMAMENMIAFRQIPRGGYIWGYLSKRLQYGLNDYNWGLMVVAPAPFDARTYTYLLFNQLDWTAMLTGLAFAAVVVVLASEYRRRRIA